MAEEIGLVETRAWEGGQASQDSSGITTQGSRRLVRGQGGRDEDSDRPVLGQVFWGTRD